VPKSNDILKKDINAIASQFPLIEQSDMSVLIRMKDAIDDIAKKSGIQRAMTTLLKRASLLIENIIMEQTDFAQGCKRLGECIDKMLSSVGLDVEPKSDAVAARPDSDAPDAPENADRVPDDMRDLLIKFAANQQPTLEDFEAYILELEKGDPRALSAIRRILHTWKGEFGVLSLQGYSRLIHEIEERLEQRAVGSDHLFRVKDFLQNCFRQFAAGACPAISAADRVLIFGQAGAGATRKFGDSTASEIVAKSASRPAESVAPGTSAADAPGCAAAVHAGDASMMGDFIHESRDHAHIAETMLLELETNPADYETINTIFRAWHTIKGVAGFLGLHEINRLAHSMENLMDKARRREIILEPAHIDLFIQSNDCLKELINAVQKMLEGEQFVVPEAYAFVMQRLVTPNSVAVDPGVPLITPEKKIGEILVEQGAISSRDIGQALDQQQQGDSRKIGEILVEENMVPARALALALAGQTAARQAKGIEETVRVPVNRIDQLIDSIGEAVIAQSMIYAYSSIASIEDQSLHTKISHGAMIMRQIQEMAMSLRMVSVKSTFQKMARLARDLGKKFDREIDFITEGEDTELDKSVVENIGDPLIHMIRNSIDHGIEPREERRAKGKAPRATIKLKAYHRAGSIYIEVSDDGRGLDKEAIFAKAISKGLCTADSHLTDQEICQFIFAPGFSTAKQVTDVSGRGVGMDVVRRNVELLRGTVETASTPGQGTTFTIRLPLTLAIVDGMVVRASDESYIIPTLAITESLKPTREQINTVLNKNTMIKVRGELIPIVHLGS
jgi:two-component system chemotaxis sensor kinase CheA